MAKSLIKAELAQTVFLKLGYPKKQVDATIQAALDTIQAALVAGRDVEFMLFGSLRVHHRKQRIARNPNLPGVEVLIPARAVVRWTSGKVLREQLKKTDLMKLKPMPE